MAAKWLSVLGVDPGGTTGVAHAMGPTNKRLVGNPTGVGIDGGATWATDQWEYQSSPLSVGGGESAVAETIVQKVEDLAVQVLVIEDFVLRNGFRTAGREGLSPVRITAAIEALLPAGAAVVVKQSASSAKGVITDDRLKRMNLWIPGKPHARDAWRHIALYMRAAGYE